MEIMKKLELELQKYLRLRKTLRLIELICLVALLITFQFSNELGVFEFICFFFATFAIPESILAIKRSNIKLDINNEDIVAKTEIKIYKQFIWEEKTDTGLLNKIKARIIEKKQKIENLSSIKKRLVVF